MSQKGTHTWDLNIGYFQCPSCGYIVESRSAYEYLFGKYQKPVECPRCNYNFTVIKKTHPTFGPFTGEPEPREMEWEKK